MGSGSARPGRPIARSEGREKAWPHPVPPPAPWLAPRGLGPPGGIGGHGRSLGEPRMGAAGAVPRGSGALSLRAAREGGARPGPGLPRALRRGRGHQLFARLLLQVRSGAEGWRGRAARAGPGCSCGAGLPAASGVWARTLGGGAARGAVAWGDWVPREECGASGWGRVVRTVLGAAVVLASGTEIRTPRNNGNHVEGGMG